MGMSYLHDMYCNKMNECIMQCLSNLMESHICIIHPKHLNLEIIYLIRTQNTLRIST